MLRQRNLLANWGLIEKADTLSLKIKPLFKVPLQSTLVG